MGERIDPYEGMTADQLDRHFSGVHAKHRAAVMFTVPLPCKPPTPNSRLHHMARARMVREIRAVVALLGRNERNRQGLGLAFTKRHVSLTLVTPKGSRMLDADNLCAAMKPCLDGCRDAGLIRDDRRAFVEVSYAQERGSALAVRVEVILDGNGELSGEGLPTPTPRQVGFADGRVVPLDHHDDGLVAEGRVDPVVQPVDRGSSGVGGVAVPNGSLLVPVLVAVDRLADVGVSALADTQRAGRRRLASLVRVDETEHALDRVHPAEIQLVDGDAESLGESASVRSLGGHSTLPPANRAGSLAEQKVELGLAQTPRLSGLPDGHAQSIPLDSANGIAYSACSDRGEDLTPPPAWPITGGSTWQS